MFTSDLGRVYGQREIEPAAHTKFAFHPDPAFMAFHDSFHDEESKPEIRVMKRRYDIKNDKDL
jgi:hypothetical protein